MNLVLSDPRTHAINYHTVLPPTVYSAGNSCPTNPDTSLQAARGKWHLRVVHGSMPSAYNTVGHVIDIQVIIE